MAFTLFPQLSTLTLSLSLAGREQYERSEYG